MLLWRLYGLMSSPGRNRLMAVDHNPTNGFSGECLTCLIVSSEIESCRSRMTYRIRICGNAFHSRRRIMNHLSDDTLESGLEPLDSILLLDLVRSADWGLSSSSAGNTGTRSRPVKSCVSRCSPYMSSLDLFSDQAWFGGILHASVEVHSVDTNCWVVLDTQVDVF